MQHYNNFEDKKLLLDKIINSCIEGFHEETLTNKGDIVQIKRVQPNIARQAIETYLKLEEAELKVQLSKKEEEQDEYKIIFKLG
jgi:hypothetical protein